ncbi:unnamed protein product [Owenia fusiformis]|uniref:Carotenoid-cleaving dioxygenase, mitochondrial n=1 Tax=Owenia fusiformis TaxID=6347 RepID=A0A8S4N380_OWEFU|nr:unnamed protein product [Owenia fusiformis]
MASSTPASPSELNFDGDGEIGKMFSTVEEHPEQIEAITTGTIPKWIKGGLLRNGPGKFEVGEDKYNHWFDGLALLHRFDFEDGVVKYHSKFLKSDSYVKAMEQNRIVISEFGTFATPDPCKGFLDRFLSKFKPSVSDNNNVNIFPIGDGVYTATETSLLRRIDHETLDTEGKVDLVNLVSVNLATAHPHYDQDGTYYNIGSNFKAGLYHVIKVKPNVNVSDPVEGAKILNTIKMESRAKPGYYHSFSMSANYIIFHEQPLRMNLLGLMVRPFFKTAIDKLMIFDRKLKSKFHICDKNTGETWQLKFVMEPFLHLHTMNSFEEDGHLVVDMACTDEASPYDDFYLSSFKKMSADDAAPKMKDVKLTQVPRRFVIPLDVTPESSKDVNLVTLSGTTATAILKEDGFVHLTYEPLYTDEFVKLSSGFDFPRINYDFYNTKPYRYCYGAGFDRILVDKLIKLDISTKSGKVWKEDEYYPSEPVFVPSPNATEEDEGVVLSVVISPNNAKPTFLLVLDGQSFTELGRATIPYDIPFGMHGMFM